MKIKPIMNIKTIIVIFAQLCSLVTTVSIRGDIHLGQEAARPELVRQPEDVTAVAGETVRLSCLVANMVEGTRCQWTKDGFGLGQDLELGLVAGPLAMHCWLCWVCRWRTGWTRWLLVVMGRR